MKRCLDLLLRTPYWNSKHHMRILACGGRAHHVAAAHQWWWREPSKPLERLLHADGKEYCRTPGYTPGGEVADFYMQR